MPNRTRRIRIQAQPGDTKPYHVVLTDLETGNPISTAYRILVEINVRSLHNNAIIFLYKASPEGKILDLYGELIQEQIVAARPEVDLTVLAESIEDQEPNRRETQFAMFAALLYEDIKDQWMDSLRYTEEVQRTIACRAYDLACHVVTQTLLTAHGNMSKIPDLASWPKEDQ